MRFNQSERRWLAMLLGSLVCANGAQADEKCSNHYVEGLEANSRSIVTICTDGKNTTIKRRLLLSAGEQKTAIGNDSQSNSSNNQANNAQKLIIDPVSLKELERIFGGNREPDNANNSAREDREKEAHMLLKRDVGHQKGMMVAAFLSAVFLFISLGLIWWNACLIRKANFQTTKMALSAKRANIHSAAGSKAAMKAVNVAIAQNRPYLALEIESAVRTRNGSADSAMSSANLIKMEARVKNYGATPAKNVTISGFLIDNTQGNDFKIELTKEVMNFIWYHEESLPDIVPQQAIDAKQLKRIKFFQKDISGCRYFLRLTYKSEFGIWHCNDYLFYIYSPLDTELSLVNIGRNQIAYGNITDPSKVDGVASELIPFNADDPLLTAVEREEKNKEA